MTDLSTIQPLLERIERLMLRYAELQRANALLAEQVNTLTLERDLLSSRLSAARNRLDDLLERIEHLANTPSSPSTEQTQ